MMKKTLCALVALTGLVISTSAQAEIQRLRAVWREDPAHNLSIGFDQVSGDSAMLYYDVVDRAGEVEKYAHKIGVVRQQKWGAMNNQFIRLADLKPDTMYYFVIRDSNSTTRQYCVRTAPDDMRDLYLIVGGDSRNYTRERQMGNRLVAKLRPDVVMFNGDYMGKASAPLMAEWLDDWQLTVGEDGLIIPLIPAHGNHENNTPDLMWRLFDMENPKGYYSLNVGGGLVQLITLNTELNDTDRKSQVEFLQQELKSKRHEHRFAIAQYHKPVRPHTKGKGEGVKQVEDFIGLFEEYGLNLAVECDTHMLKYTYPIVHDPEGKLPNSQEGFARDDQRGIVYIGEGGWGAPKRPVDDSKIWTRASDSLYHFQWLKVSKDAITVRTVLFDKKTAHKDIPVVADTDRWKIPQGLKMWEPEGTGVDLEVPCRKTSEPQE